MTYRIEFTGVLGDKHLSAARYTDREWARALVREYRRTMWYSGLRMALSDVRVVEG